MDIKQGEWGAERNGRGAELACQMCVFELISGEVKAKRRAPPGEPASGRPKARAKT